jgi:hypothetical protein
MLTYGSQVNPSLGRVDYSPLLQGAMARAQGTQQAGQAYGQAFANFGQSVAQGIQAFAKKQEEKQNEKEGINFIKAQFPGIGDAEAKAGLKAAGGAAAFVKFRQDMAQNQMAQRAQALQLAEFERTAAERSRLAQAMTASPAQMAMAGGATFEQLPTGAGAFLSSAPANTSEFIKRAQEAKIDPSVWLPQAIQFSQVEENVGQAKARGANLGGYNTPEDALKEAERLSKGRKGFAPSFSVVQGRYFPAFREESPAAFETESAKLKAKSAQDTLDKTKSAFSTQIAAEQSADMVLKGLEGKGKTGVFAPVFTFVKRVASEFNLPVEGLNEQLILEKGIAGMQAGQIQVLARGLGSMSNADREFFVSSFPSIKDSPQVNKFFAEMAKENAKFAREDQALIRKLERENVEVAEINRIIDERRESRNVANSVFERVFKGQPIVQTPAPATGGGRISPQTATFIPSP